MRPLTIRLSARAAVARGLRFTESVDVFHDADVALDEIRGLPPPPEPLVLRVVATGGTAQERASVAGDWFCEASVGDPVRLPKPDWTLTLDSMRWSRNRPWLGAWEACPRPDWMVFEAAKAGVDPRRIVGAACRCVKESTRHLEPVDPAIERCVDLAESWADTGRWDDTFEQAANAAYRVSTQAPSQEYRMLALAAHELACAADYYGHTSLLDVARASSLRAIRYAAALPLQPPQRRIALRRSFVRFVRASIPTEVVLRAVALRAKRA